MRQALAPLGKGGVFLLIKMLVGGGAGWAVNRWCGSAGLWGLAPLAIVPALANGSGGLYMALAAEYGDATDMGAQSVLLVNDGPFFTMLIFGGAGMAEIPASALLASIIPLALGFIMGNLDAEIRSRFGNPETLIPFFGFCLGAGMDLRYVAAAGSSGLILGLACLFVCGFAGYLSTRLFSDRCRAVGAAIGSTSGNAMTTPMFLAAADASLSPQVGIASAQIAAAAIVTAFLCPALVAGLHRLDGTRRHGLTHSG